MTESNSLLGFLNRIKDEFANQSKVTNYRDLKLTKELKNNKKYLFKPLENIPSKKGKEEENRNGFLVYSKETIKSKLINRTETLEKRFKCIYKKCNDYKKIKDNENYIYRYYYYQELEYEDKEIPLKEIATIIMINPAFASSQDNDPTINNICDFLKSLRFKSFEIVNLYPIRLPKPDCLDCFNLYLDFNKKNIYYKLLNEYLKQKSDSGSILIAAWGDKYNTVAQEIFKNSDLKFKSYKKGAPAHFSPQRYNNVKDKDLYDFISFASTEIDA